MVKQPEQDLDPLTEGAGTEKPWYQGWDLSAEERAVFRARSARSKAARDRAMRGEAGPPLHPINLPRFDPAALMSKRRGNGLRALSLFSGGGGLDLGFERAGFRHVASFEIIEDAGVTLRTNRPKWDVRAGADGDVRAASWKEFRGKVDVIHGGPPCQPFSASGRQHGANDVRDMFPEFVRAVSVVKPMAFVAENVPALLQTKFSDYLNQTLIAPLEKTYSITRFVLSAEQFGVPQIRRRVFFVGIERALDRSFLEPVPTHEPRGQKVRQATMFSPRMPRCVGVREALGLPNIGVDGPAPTLRSGLTGPRHTTSVLSSVSAQRMWASLQVWPNGVALTRERAHAYPADNGHFRLSVPDCGLLQGFPEEWKFHGAVYMALGQIGNSVVPPVAYAVACSISAVLS